MRRHGPAGPGVLLALVLTVGLDLDTGLGVIKLEDPGPWPVATLGRSEEAVAGMRTGTVGIDDDGDLVQLVGQLQAIQRFSAYWEFMLDRAFVISPASPGWGGSAVVNERGEVVGVVSLRLGEPPYTNLAIPIEKFVPGKDELIGAGRIVSRPPRPWLGLYAVEAHGGLFVSEVSPLGPAARAGVLKGDRIVRVNGVAVQSREDFYLELWSRRAGDLIEMAVQRADRVRVITVPSIDRHTLYRPRDLPRGSLGGADRGAPARGRAPARRRPRAVRTFLRRQLPRRLRPDPRARRSADHP